MSGCVFSPCKLVESPEVTLLWAVPREQESKAEALWDSSLGPGGEVLPCPAPPAEPGEPYAWLRAPLGRKAGVGREDMAVFSRPLHRAVALKVLEEPAGELAWPWRGSLEQR